MPCSVPRPRHLPLSRLNRRPFSASNHVFLPPLSSFLDRVLSSPPLPRPYPPSHSQLPPVNCRRSTPMTISRLYLLAYNSVQCILWAHAFVRLALTFLHPPHYISSASLFASAATAAHPSVLFAQTLAWLELLHALLSLSPSRPAPTFIQCLGRFSLVRFLLDPLPATRAHPAAPILFAVWSLADLLRYALYIATAVANPPFALVWLRYSAFVVLQPLGIVAEWLLYWHSLPLVDAVDLYRVTLPNRFNFAFDYAVAIHVFLALYFYFGPVMMLHMFRQRRSKLSSQAYKPRAA